MKITCHHPASSYGIPVILDDDGNVMDYAPGLATALDRLGWTWQRLALFWGHSTARSVERYRQGLAVPPAAKLNMLAVELDRLT